MRLDINNKATVDFFFLLAAAINTSLDGLDDLDRHQATEMVCVFMCVCAMFKVNKYLRLPSADTLGPSGARVYS